MTTPNTTPSPTQRVVRARLYFDGETVIPYEDALQLATEYEATQKELAKWKGREPEIYQHKETRRRAIITSCKIDGGNNSGEPMDVIDKCIQDLRQQLADKTRECERLKGVMAGTVASHTIAAFELADKLGHGLSSRPPVLIIEEVINQLRTENAELKKDKERLDWLENTGTWGLFTPTIPVKCPPDKKLRTAIDAARKEQK